MHACRIMIIRYFSMILLWVDTNEGSSYTFGISPSSESWLENNLELTWISFVRGFRTTQNMVLSIEQDRLSWAWSLDLQSCQCLVWTLESPWSYTTSHSTTSIFVIGSKLQGALQSNVRREPLTPPKNSFFHSCPSLEFFLQLKPIIQYTCII